MSWDNWKPIDHRPPLKRFETDPQYTPAAPSLIPKHIREQIEHMEQILRKKEGERMWQTIVDVARST